MRNQLLVWMGVLLLAGVVLAAAQAPAAPAKKYNPPRMADGHPDLNGTYDAATLTPLERNPGSKPTMTKEEAAKQEGIAAALKQEGDKSIDGNRTAPPKGGDGSFGPAGNVGGYNSGWIDPGNTFTVVNGEIRSSIVVDPPDGRAPALVKGSKAGPSAYGGSLSGTQLLQLLLTPRPPRPTSDQTESSDPGLEKSSRRL